MRESGVSCCRTWLPVRCHNDDDDNDHAGGCWSVQLSYQATSVDGRRLPSRVWRCVVDVKTARPLDVLAALVRQRHAWDETVTRWRVLERLDDSTDLFHYVIAPPVTSSSVTSSSPSSAAAEVVLPRPSVDVCELR